MRPQKQHLTIDSPSQQSHQYLNPFNINEHLMPSSNIIYDDLMPPHRIHSQHLSPMHNLSVPRLSEPLLHQLKLSPSSTSQQHVLQEVLYEPQRKSMNHILVQGDAYTSLQQPLVSRNGIPNSNTVGPNVNSSNLNLQEAPIYNNYITATPSQRQQHQQYSQQQLDHHQQQTTLNNRRSALVQLPPLKQPSSPLNIKNPFLEPTSSQHVKQPKQAQMEPLSGLNSVVAGITTNINTPAQINEPRTSTIIQEDRSGTRVQMNFTQFVDNFECTTKDDVSRNTASKQRFYEEAEESPQLVVNAQSGQPMVQTCLTCINANRGKVSVDAQTQIFDAFEDGRQNRLGLESTVGDNEEKILQQKLFEQLSQQIFEIHGIFEQFNTLNLSTFNSKKEKRVVQSGLKASQNQQYLLEDLKELHSNISIWAQAHVKDLSQNIQKLSERMQNLQQIHADNGHKIKAYEHQIEKLKKELKEANDQLLNRESQQNTTTGPEKTVNVSIRATQLQTQLDDVVQDFAEQVQSQVDKMNNSHQRISGVSMDPPQEPQRRKFEELEDIAKTQKIEEQNLSLKTESQLSWVTQRVPVDLAQTQQIESQPKADESPEIQIPTQSLPISSEQLHDGIQEPTGNLDLAVVGQQSDPIIDLKPIQNNSEQQQLEQPEIKVEDVCSKDQALHHGQIEEPFEVNIDQIAEVPMEIINENQIQSPPELICQDEVPQAALNQQIEHINQEKQNIIDQAVEQVQLQDDQIFDKQLEMKPEVQQEEEAQAVSARQEVQQQQDQNKIEEIENLGEQQGFKNDVEQVVEVNVAEPPKQPETMSFPEKQNNVETQKENKTEIQQDGPVEATEAKQKEETPVEPENKEGPPAAEPEKTDEEKRRDLQAKLAVLFGNLKKSIDKENAEKAKNNEDQAVQDAKANAKKNMNAGNLQNLLGNQMLNIMKKKEREIQQSLKDAKSETEKMSIWDQHMAQKRLEECNIKSTLQIKLSDIFKGINPRWQDDAKGSDLAERQRREQEEERAKAQKNQKKKRTVHDIIQTKEYDQQIKRLNAEYSGAQIKSVDVNNVISDNIIQEIQLNDRKKQREKFMLKLKEKYQNQGK